MVKCRFANISLIPLMTGAVSGMLGGIMGVGGGVLLIPLFSKQINDDQHLAHGSSLAVIFFISLAGAIIYATRGSVDWLLAMEIGAGSLVGVVIGAKLMIF